MITDVGYLTALYNLGAYLTVPFSSTTPTFTLTPVLWHPKAVPVGSDPAVSFNVKQDVRILRRRTFRVGI
jgi:hypothetical protein